MKPDAKIKTTDLELALDYLEGLSFIMRSFDESSRGREGRDILLEVLQAMDSGAMSWKPLRRQAAAGQGWADIADQSTSSVADCWRVSPTPHSDRTMPSNVPAYHGGYHKGCFRRNDKDPKSVTFTNEMERHRSRRVGTRRQRCQVQRLPRISPGHPRPAMLADYEGTEHAARRVLDKRMENHVPST
jgi:hypothetical protein